MFFEKIKKAERLDYGQVLKDSMTFSQVLKDGTSFIWNKYILFMDPSNVQYMVTSHQSFITEKHEAVMAFEPNIRPVLDKNFCGPEMGHEYTVQSMYNSHLCLFGYIPSPKDTTYSRANIHSILTLNFMIPADVYVMALCVNNVKQYKGAGKIFKDMIYVMRKTKMRRITLDSLDTENTLQFYAKHKFTHDEPISVSTRMNRDLTPASMSASPGEFIGSESFRLKQLDNPKTDENSHLLDWLKKEMTTQDMKEWVSNMRMTPDNKIAMDIIPLPKPPNKRTSSRDAFRSSTRAVAPVTRKNRFRVRNRSTIIPTKSRRNKGRA